jgi:hypothetical protein
VKHLALFAFGQILGSYSYLKKYPTSFARGAKMSNFPDAPGGSPGYTSPTVTHFQGKK